MSRRPKRAKGSKKKLSASSKKVTKKALSLAERFAASAERRVLVERVARAEREREEAVTRLHDLQERIAITHEGKVTIGDSVELPAERMQRVLLRNSDWEVRGGKVREAYIEPLETVFGPLELPLWQDAGVRLTDQKARELAELFQLERRDIYSIYFSP